MSSPNFNRTQSDGRAAGVKEILSKNLYDVLMIDEKSIPAKMENKSQNKEGQPVIA